jgi:hypothetical protein
MQCTRCGFGAEADGFPGLSGVEARAIPKGDQRPVAERQETDLGVELSVA